MLPDQNRNETNLRVINYLRESDLIPKEIGDRLERISKRSSEMIDTIILELGMLDETRLTEALSELFEIELLDLDNENVEEFFLAEFPSGFYLSNHVLPLQLSDNEITLVCANPFDDFVKTSLEFKTETCVRFALAPRRQIEKFLGELLSTVEEQNHAPSIFGVIENLDDGDLTRLEEAASQAPIIRKLDNIIQLAVENGASDIHFEPSKDHLEVRFRQDGDLKVVEKLPAAMKTPLTCRLKVISKLNISEIRRPQDGRVNLVVSGRAIDCRVSTVPISHGETVVLRLLRRDMLTHNWSELGFSRDTQISLKQVLNCPNGLFLTCGPTGSGKTTTLYSALRELNSKTKKLFTVEDPIEFQLDGVCQLQVKPDIDLTFANALRSILRQDPDVILVGEIRDPETAQIAVQAALTGHLVLATLHTNSAISAISRLKNMGVEPYMLAASTRGILAQRLVRRQCNECKNDRVKSSCSVCKGEGTLGRTLVTEFLNVTSEIQQAISANEPEATLLSIAKNSGMVSMVDNARSLLNRQIISEIEFKRLGQE